MFCEEERAPVLAEVPAEPPKRRWVIDWFQVTMCGSVLVRHGTVVAWLWEEGEPAKLLGDVYVEPVTSMHLDPALSSAHVENVNNWTGRVDGAEVGARGPQVFIEPGVDGARRALRYCQEDVEAVLDERARGAA